MRASQRVGRHVIVALAMTIAAAGAARADSFAVTAGFFGAEYQKNIAFQFVGQGLFLTGSTDSGNFDAWLCRPCAGGDTVGTSGYTSGTTLGGGTATINGTQYTNLSYSSQLQFTGTSFTISPTIQTSCPSVPPCPSPLPAGWPATSRGNRGRCSR